MSGRAYWELTKPRLSLLAVLTAVAGYLAAVPGGGASWSTLGWLTLGTALAAGACGALNQWMERGPDARMRRTAGRPLPTGALRPRQALAFGLALLAAGLAAVGWGANFAAMAMTAATAVTYLFLYTPLKYRTPWCTVAGSLPGALPVLIGSAARTGGVSPFDLAVFSLLFCWQVPHFMGLAVLWREDYAAGGFRVATVDDPSGDSAARQSSVFLAGTLAASAAPVLIDRSLVAYAAVAVLAGIAFARLGLRFHRGGSRAAAARPFFLFSLLYLPLVLLALVLDRMF
jgi:protoheme IX farnesyltransferase